MDGKVKVLITTYVGLERGGIASTSLVVEAENRGAANQMLANLQRAEDTACRVHYDAVILN